MVGPSSSEGITFEERREVQGGSDGPQEEGKILKMSAATLPSCGGLWLALWLLFQCLSTGKTRFERAPKRSVGDSDEASIKDICN